MNLPQTAHTAIRLARIRGLSLRVEQTVGAEPILHVSPKTRLTPWLQQALVRCKSEVVALLATEGQGACTAADGTRWQQTLARCETCGASDWGVIGQEMVKDALVDAWACLVCHTPADLLQQQLEQAALDLRWPGTKQMNNPAESIPQPDSVSNAEKGA